MFPKSKEQIEKEVQQILADHDAVLPVISEAEWQANFERTKRELARIPRGLLQFWVLHPQESLPPSLVGHFVFDHLQRGLRVIFTVEGREDGKWWLHVSASRRDGTLPDYYDMLDVKNIFIGPDRQALQIYPKRSHHVNMGEVQHLWCALDGDGLPDFGKHGTI